MGHSKENIAKINIINALPNTKYLIVDNNIFIL